MAEMNATEHLEDDRYNVFDVEGLTPVIADMGTGDVDDTIPGQALSSCEELFPPPPSWLRLHNFRITQEIEIGLAHHRTMAIVNRDFKPANILLRDCYVVGPENRGKETTQGSEMEQSKGMAKVGFYHQMKLQEEVLSRFSNKSSAPFSSYMESVEGMLSGGEMSDCEGKMFYSNTDRNGLLRKKILDGAFVLEILGHIEMAENPEFVSDFPSNDPIFSCQGMLYNLPFIRRGLLNINNQVPLRILEMMVSLQSGVTDKKGVRKEIVLKLLNLLVPSLQPSNFDGLHALDIIRNNLVSNKAPQPLPHLVSCFHAMDCITHLAGIWRNGHHDSKFQSLSSVVVGNIRATGYKSIQGGIFRARSLAKSFMTDISFFQCGLLRLHTLTIDDTTEDLFTNLMAFERHQHGRKGWQVTSYVYFMSSLIQSPQDAGLLRRSCIIKTARMSDHEVAKLFVRLRSGITLQSSDYCLMKTHLEILSYHRKACPLWVASLWSSFLEDPLAFVFCMAALLLVVVHLLSMVVFGRI